MKRNKESQKVMRTDQFFRCLADHTRLTILVLLWPDKEYSLTQLAMWLKISEAQVARHLALLIKHSLVIERREELQRFVRFNQGLPKWAYKVVKHTYSGNRLSLLPMLSDGDEQEDNVSLPVDAQRHIAG